MSSQRESEHRALGFTQAILDTLREPFVVLDSELRVCMASRSFYRLFHVSSDETEGRILFDLGNGQWKIPELHQLLDHILVKGSTFEDYEVDHQFPVIGSRTFLLNAREVLVEVPGSKLILLAMEDITDRKIAEKELHRLATTDNLTGLANRNAFNKALDTAIKGGRRFNYGVSLLLLDLDRFKAVNDTHGHPYGDALLQSVAKIMGAGLREIDLAARLGGDEFAVILVGANKKADVDALAQRYVDSIGQPFQIDGHAISIGVSIGIAHFPTDADNVEDLVRRADLALYQAKDDGRGTFRMFMPECEL